MTGPRSELKPSENAPASPRAPIAPSNFLGQLNATDLATLENIATVQRFSRGEYVYRAGAPGNNAYVLRRGKVKIHQLSPSGREAILWFCLSGEVFGLSEIATGGARAVNAQACDQCEVLVIPRADFRGFLAAHPDAALLAMQVLSSRMRVLGEIFVNLVSDDVNTRIAKLIVRLAAHYGTRVGKDVVLNIPLTHQEVADMVGTSRQTVTSMFSALNRKGVLRIDNHRICIESPELLDGFTHDPAAPNAEQAPKNGRRSL